VSIFFRLSPSIMPKDAVDAALPVPPTERTAFNFENAYRNMRLEKEGGVVPPKARKTGTTVSGMLFKGGVILGADTRATCGDIVVEKNCEKLHELAPNIFCAGAGTVADIQGVIRMVKSTLALQRLNTGKQSRVATAERLLKHHLFQYQGHLGVYLIIGGVDVTGPHLVSVGANGHTQVAPYNTQGSGSFAAMSILEMEYKDDMAEKDAIELIKKAIDRGIYEDLGSGSNVDIRVIRREGMEYLHNCVPYSAPTKPRLYKFPTGTTVVLKETVKMLDADAMQTD